MAQDVDHSPQVPNQVPDQVPEQATIRGNPKKQKITKKSGLAGNHGKFEVWNFFKKVLEEETGKYKGIAICVFCEARITAPSRIGTNKLWSHTRTCKKFPRDEQDNAQTLISVMGGQTCNWKFDQELCRSFLAKMIILCELPFSFVEKEGFRMFCEVIQPKFHVVSRTTITKDCLQIYHEEKSKLKDYFKEISARICIITDLWTSVQNLGYMVLTAHFVDKDWVLRKKIINFRVLPHPHKGEVIAKAIENCLLEWGIEKVMTITLDNAKNNDTCVMDLKKRFNKRNMMLLGGQFFHVRCFAHVINLVVRDGIEEVKTTIKRLRRSVKYVRSSSSRLQMFKKCALEESVTCKKVVCLDVKTRWNSTYLMINAAMEFEKVFDRLLEHDPFYRSECELKKNKEDGSELGLKKKKGGSGCHEGGPINEDDWRKLRSLHTFLEDFYLLTKRISGSHYITSNSYFDEVTQTKDMLLQQMGSNDVFLSSMAKKMNEKFEKYCNIDALNPILIASIVLDPRYKLDYVTFWYRSYLDSDILLSEDEKDKKVEDWVERFKSMMSRLYLHYKSEATSLDDQSSNSESVVAN
ncbi:hypothetical protein L3X38_006970 [Prunus dulcis]|uniref:hAT-like transposase RNase-H fold domain-containing protein n=2 Tax=Prunus dulcis TaxID=3755 RepID=A0AAD4ZTS9_PRUDU|nr:hypothetical protein L3X38_006970 [Prunus dulcis]